MLGGSSALNFLMVLHPSRGILDSWSQLGNAGWDYDTLAPYFRKFQTVHAPPKAARDMCAMTYHEDETATGTGNGPIQVSFSEGYGPTNKAWFETFAQNGLEVKTDYRSGKALGAFQNPASIDPVTHTRSYAASAYYTPEIAARANLVVLTETVVNKIVFDTSSGPEPVATGVEILPKGGQKRTVTATTEVILSAGALQSPQILELSGIGGRDLLTKHGIPVLVDNPNVGEHMQDHPILCQSFEVAEGTPSGDVLRDPNVLNALVGMYTQNNGAGPLGQSNISVAYTPLVDGNGILSEPEKQKLFAPHESSFSSDDLKTVRNLITKSDEPAFQQLLFPTQITITPNPVSMAEYIVPCQPDNYVTVMTMLNHPFSRGSVHISSADVNAAPVWDPKYNSHPLDMELLARAAQFVEGKLVHPESPLGKMLKPAGEGKRMPDIVGADKDLEKAREVVRQRQISVFHVAGSCSMLPKEKGGVVDTRLRVYGTKKLRVVDASIFPLEPLGNIQSCVYAVAERAADLIKEDRKAKKN